MAGFLDGLEGLLGNNKKGGKKAAKKQSDFWSGLGGETEGEDEAPEEFAPVNEQLYLSQRKGSTHGAKLIPQDLEVRLGRTQEKVTVVIPGRTVSEEHAEFRYEHGKYYIYDLGSTNGTYVNGEKIDGAPGVEVKDGDRISFGRKVVYYAVFEEVQETQTADGGFVLPGM